MPDNKKRDYSNRENGTGAQSGTEQIRTGYENSRETYGQRNGQENYCGQNYRADNSQSDQNQGNYGSGNNQNWQGRGYGPYGQNVQSQEGYDPGSYQNYPGYQGQRGYGPGSYQNCQNPGYGTGHGQNAQNWGNYGPGNNQNWQGRGYGPCNQESYRGPGYGAGNGQNYYPGSQGYGEDMAGNRKKKKKKRRKSLFILELIILLILAVGVFACTRLARMEHISLKNILTNVGAASQDGYQNIVIYGVDSREGDLTTDAHSDTIIICSINKKTKDIKMVSVYRDTYLDNTNGEYRKATECYFFGGPERSINMLNKNLDLDIRDYVAVDFNAVVKAVDLIGGIDMDITDEELQWLNGYCVENSAVTGVGYTPLESSGYQHLDGIQTLAYCRIRYTDGYDFKRTERQRSVLTKIFEKAKEEGVTTLLSMVDTMLPYISTSLSNTEIVSLATGIGSYQLGENTGFPFEQTPMDLSDAGDCVVPVNLAQNVTELHSYLFGTDGYTPSQTVQEISNTIINNTGVQ